MSERRNHLRGRNIHVALAVTGRVLFLIPRVMQINARASVNNYLFSPMRYTLETRRVC